jgi:hypothetical protein
MLDVEIVGSSEHQSNESQPASIGTASIEQSTHSSRSSSFVNIDQTGIPHHELNGSIPSAVSFMASFGLKRCF